MNRGSDGIPMIAWATHSVTISASLIRRRALLDALGQEIVSDAVNNQ